MKKEHKKMFAGLRAAAATAATKKQVTPEQMELIINCQTMIKKIEANYDQFEGFETLELLSVDELRRLQEGLIPKYNKAVQTTKN
jgi:hypothetical protein